MRYCHFCVSPVNYSDFDSETGSMTVILEELKCETLQKQRKDNRANRLILLYKGLKGKARIPTADLIPKKQALQKSTLATLNGLGFQIPSASKDAYKKTPNYKGLECPP